MTHKYGSHQSNQFGCPTCDQCDTSEMFVINDTDMFMLCKRQGDIQVTGTMREKHIMCF